MFPVVLLLNLRTIKFLRFNILFRSCYMCEYCSSLNCVYFLAQSVCSLPRCCVVCCCHLQNLVDIACLLCLIIFRVLIAAC